jgi:apolipoprotein N-acyltransferase
MLMGYFIFVIYPFVGVDGRWWVLESRTLISLQYALVMFSAAFIRALVFLPVAFAVRYYGRHPFGGIGIALLWALLEWAHATFGLWGYSLGALGYALVDAKYTRAFAGFGGVYALSFLIVLGNMTLAQLCIYFQNKKNSQKIQSFFPLHTFIHRVRMYPSMFLFMIIIGGTFAYTLVRGVAAGSGGERIRVVVVSSMLSTREGVGESGYRAYRRDLVDALAYHPDIVVFPENTFPYFEINEEDGSLVQNSFIQFQDRNALYDDFTKLLRAYPTTTVVVGMHSYRSGQRYNTAVFLKGGVAVNYYEKRVLVPFAEYIPQGLSLPLRVRFARGDAKQYFEIKNITTTALVCSEIGDTTIAIGESAVILSPSSDDIFQSSAPALMHRQMAKMRAIENHAYVLRATKGEVADIIDQYGNVISEGAGRVLVADIAVPSH